MSYITDPTGGHLFLVGNTGGSVYPDAGRFSILGSGVISVAGDPLTSTLTITAGSSVATTFTADSGVATPALNTLKIVGGSNVNTSATGNTVTINVGGLTPYAVQVGDTLGKLHSIAVGTNGQVIVGNTGGYPVFATIGISNGLGSTIGAGTLSIYGITASTTEIGVSLLATDAETLAGTNTDHNLTPSNLKYKLGVQTQYALPVGAGDSAAFGWLAVGGTGEGLMGSTGANPGWTNSPSFGGSVTAATSITATANDITATAGKVKTTNNSIEVGSTAASAVANDLDFKKSRTGGVITTADELGNIAFWGHDGTDYVLSSAIECISSGTIATNRVASSLQFSTHPDSTTAAIKRLEIKSTGEVIVSASDSGNPLTVTAGNLAISDGNLVFPSTSATGGTVTINSVKLLHSYGTLNAFVAAGNVTLSNAAYNSGLGHSSLAAIVGTNAGDGSYNTACGYQSMLNATNSKRCIAIGYSAGSSWNASEDSSIAIGSTGTAAESNSIRIGGGTGTGSGQQNATYISGIYGITAGATNGLVQVDNSNKLGYTNSPSVTGSVTAGTDLISTAGHASIPLTNYTFTQGVYKIGGYKAVHMLGGNTNIWVGDEVANSRGTGFYQSCTYNTGVGYSALGEIWVNSHYNTAIGANALAALGNPSSSGAASGNTAIGYNALGGTNGDANYNTIIGYNAMAGNTNADYSVMIGYNVGSSVGGSGTQGASCIYILNAGGNENNKIRIGTQGTGNGQQDACYIAGIYGVTPGGTKNVGLVDSNGQLGSTATLAQSYLANGLTWNNVTGTTQAAAVNNEYTANNAGLVTITLPSTAAVNDRVKIVGAGAGGWKLAQNSGQTIHWGSIDSTTGITGYIASAVRYDCVEVVCTIANTDWVVCGSEGQLTII